MLYKKDEENANLKAVEIRHPFVIYKANFVMKSLFHEGIPPFSIHE